MKHPRKLVTPQKSAAPTPDVRVRDEIYFRHNGEPHHGVVLATGRHGATVQHAGGRRKVPWSDMIGHKSRADTKMRVIASGDDGAIVADEAGRRQFLAGYTPRDADELPGNTNAEPQPNNVPRERGAAVSKSAPTILLFGDRSMLKAMAADAAVITASGAASEPD